MRIFPVKVFQAEVEPGQKHPHSRNCPPKSNWRAFLRRNWLLSVERRQNRPHKAIRTRNNRRRARQKRRRLPKRMRLKKALKPRKKQNRVTEPKSPPTARPSPLRLG